MTIYSKSLSWAENLNKMFTILGRKFIFSAQDSEFEYLFWRSKNSPVSSDSKPTLAVRKLCFTLFFESSPSSQVWLVCKICSTLLNLATGHWKSVLSANTIWSDLSSLPFYESWASCLEHSQLGQILLKKVTFESLARDIHIECSKQFKWNPYFYVFGQSGPFWVVLKLLWNTNTY